MVERTPVEEPTPVEVELFLTFCALPLTGKAEHLLGHAGTYSLSGRAVAIVSLTTGAVHLLLSFGRVVECSGVGEEKGGDIYLRPI